MDPLGPAGAERVTTSSVLRPSAAILGAKIASAACLSAAAVVSARQLGPSGRGVLVLLLTIALFTVVAGGFGVGTAARVALVARKDALRVADYLGVVIFLVLVQAALCASAEALLSRLIGVDVGAAELALATCYGMATLADVLLLDALLGLGRTTGAAVVDAVGSAFQVPLVIALALTHQESVALYLAAMTTGALVQAIVSLVALRRSGHSLSPTTDLQVAATLAREGYPAVGMTLAETLTYRIDRYLIGAFLNPAAVGVYSVASTASELVRVGAYAVSQVLFHRVASGPVSRDDVARIRRMTLAAVVLAGVAVAAVAPTLIRLVFGNSFAGAARPLQILLLGEIAISVFLVDSAVAIPLGSLKGSALAALAGMVVVVVADIVLIPRHGIVGAAWASVLGYATMAVAMRRVLATSGMASDVRNRRDR